MRLIELTAMKIGIDIRALMDPLHSGVPEFTLNLLEGLFRLDKKNEYVLFYNSARDISKIIPEFREANVQVVASRYPNKLFNNIMQQFIKWPKLDQLTGVDLFFMPNIGFAALSSSVRKVITIHDLSFLRYGEFFSLKRRAWHRLINLTKMLRGFDQIIAISEHTKQDLRELCHLPSRRIKVIYNGLAPVYHAQIVSDLRKSQVQRKYKLPPEFILYLGTLEPRKNVIGLIKAYELLYKKKGSRCPALVIAGGVGWKYQQIFRAAKESAAHERIKFIGYVDEVDKPILYKLAQAFVYPSFYEGFGFPPLEAMAAGCPTIISSSASLSEVAQGGAILVDPYNAAEITQAMELILTDEKLRIDMISKGQKQAKNYSWERTARSYLKFFRAW